MNIVPTSLANGDSAAQQLIWVIFFFTETRRLCAIQKFCESILFHKKVQPAKKRKKELAEYLKK